MNPRPLGYAPTGCWQPKDFLLRCAGSCRCPWRPLGRPELSVARRGGTAGERLITEWGAVAVCGSSPHPLRHRYATRVYGGSGDLLAVQKLLGHSSPETTQRYVLMDAERLRRACEGI